MMKVRRPYVAGTFYEASPLLLRKQVEECFLHPLGPGEIPQVAEDGPRRIIGLLCPHAGYMYSGPVAAHAYHSLAVDGKIDLAVIFGPNHSGYGSAIAIMNEGVWHTPLGDVEVDIEVADEIVRLSNIVDVDEVAHRYEHSIEVQLPFLQYLYGSSFRIVPICFMMQELDSARDVGLAVAKAIDDRNAVIIASSDMTHYEPHQIAQVKDSKALEAVKCMDEGRFYHVIEDYGVTACGVGPIIALISAAKELGVKEAKLLCYKTSGDVSGEYSSVVGYAAVQFAKLW